MQSVDNCIPIPTLTGSEEGLTSAHGVAIKRRWQKRGDASQWDFALSSLSLLSLFSRSLFSLVLSNPQGIFWRVTFFQGQLTRRELSKEASQPEEARRRRRLSRKLFFPSRAQRRDACVLNISTAIDWQRRRRRLSSLDDVGVTE